MNYLVIETTVEEYDDIIYENDKTRQFSHFSIRNGKAHYHAIHLPDYSCGIYYALNLQSTTLKKRQMKPGTVLKVYFIQE